MNERTEGSRQRLGYLPLAVVDPAGLFNPDMLIPEGE